MAARVAWVLSGIVVLLVAGALILGLALTRPAVIGISDGVWLMALSSYAVAGAFIASRHPGNGVGWLLITVGVLVAVAGLADAYAGYALATGAPGGVLARWLQSLLWDPAFGLLLVGLPLLFPTGRLPGRWWRVVVVAAGLAMLTLVAVSAVEPGPIGTDLPVANPFGWQAAARVLELVDGIAEATLLLTALLAAAAPFVRYRRAGPTERQQLLWFAFAIGLLVFLSAASATADLLPIGDSLGVALEIAAIASVPVAIGVSIVRHGLYDIRLVVSRTLTYAILSSAILLLYVGVVGGVGAIVSDTDDASLPLLVVVVVAVALHPARVRLQGLVERRLFGMVRDPYAALQQLGRRLASPADQQDALRSIVATVREALRLPYAAIEPAGGSPVADGQPTERVRIPMEHAGMPVGHLVVSPPGGQRTLSPPERQLLEDLGRLAAVAVHTTQLTDQLLRSRQALVDAREDERRRLRRNLHDGLGPDLAGLALRLEATATLLGDTSQAARTELTMMADQLRGAVDEVRRIVYDLRPPALDDLGLVQALRQRVAGFRHGDPEGGRPPLIVRFDVGGDVTTLPAAVEVAAYRIVTEAMTNVWRHSDARHCTVGMRVGARFSVDITDDGAGISATASAGVGIRSMIERANELGGRCWIGEAPEGGAHVRVRIPLSTP